ncbi:thiamine pyrophosphate-binding protein [Corynebacterium alimapuense]|uniref:thiamine pyrophosphate-binding protein n=1 Tax=Corynebacterium alimapuense TaxID=1576874 RepID=UPI001FE93842|nr:thiamine pyrophosphate-binding protein [Corynebacterium alimapuense]
MPQHTRVSTVVADALLAHVSCFFGVMGHGNAWFIDAVEKYGPGLIPVRHEVAAVAAADAYQRVTGKIAVATTTFGPGFSNTLTALAEAVQAQIPLLLVTGGPPAGGFRSQDIDQRAAATAVGVTTLSVGVDDAGELAIQALALALHTRRPVVLELPYDIAMLSVTDEGARIPTLPPVPLAPELGDEDVIRIVDALAFADRPLILAGRGVGHCGRALRALATSLKCQVATTAPARGLFVPESDESIGFSDLGVCGGFATAEVAGRIRKADVVLILGAGLNQFTTNHGQAFHSSATLIQIDLADVATWEGVSNFYQADVAGAIAALSAELARREGFTPQDGLVLAAKPVDVSVGEGLAADGLLDPRGLTARLNELLPADRLVAIDGGHFISWPATGLDLAGPDHLVMVGTAFQSIGLGFASGVGVAAAAGERVSVLATGDGGGLMGLADAESFIRVAQRGVVIVYNDASYGAERHQFFNRGLELAPMLIPEVDFAAVFRALGARSEVIRTLADLDDFGEWINSGQLGCYLRDCRISPAVVAPFIKGLSGE